jgi:hypothetical protein
MDQGLAALLGATVGVLGTVAASAISSGATRRQLEGQAKVEHSQWRRQLRRDAYSAFLAPANESRSVLKMAARALIGDAPDVAEADRRLQIAQDQLVRVQAAWAGLAVEGPDSVEQAEVPPANWTAGVYAAGTRFCLSKDLVSSGVTYP